MQNPKPVITNFIPDLAVGGAQRVVINLMKGFGQYNVERDLVLLNDRNLPLLSEVPSNVNVTVLDVSGVSRSVPSLVRYLKERKPNAIFSHMTHASAAFSLARLFSGVPCKHYWVEHVPISMIRSPGSVGRRAGLISLSARLSHRLADGIIACSQGVADDWIQTMRVPNARIQKIFNPVVTEDFLQNINATPAHRWLRQKDRPVIVTVGRLVPEKDHAALLEAFFLLRKQRSARLVIFGDGPERKKLTEMLNASPYVTDVDLPGGLNYKDIPATLHHADLFALSSKFEGFGNVLVEALVSGCPVVSTDCPTGPTEILENGSFGELVPVGDAAAMAEAMIRGLDKPRQAENNRARGLLFRADHAARQYLDLCGI